MCNALQPIIRVNATELFVCRVKNLKDLDTLIDEASAVLENRTLMKLCHAATNEPYIFHVKLTTKDKDDMCFLNLNKRLIIQYAY